MIIITLGILFIILVCLGLMESHFHRMALGQLPIRIHVNGSRGKSSVTRLIAAGLRAGGLKTLAKTTGTTPRIIDENGKDRGIHRLRSASIGEQVRLLLNFAKKNPDAVVMECMAVNPQYQWVAEHKMIKSTIGVITNVRPDHLDEMGLTLKENALSLSNTIPHNGTLVIVAGDLNQDGKIDTVDQQIDDVFIDISKKRKTKLWRASSKNISSDYMRRFEYLEHVDNVALALKVCKLSGVDEKTALDGMIQAQPDPGATIIWKTDFSGKHNYFVNLLAANDPASTYSVFKQLQPRIRNAPLCIFLNTRGDRRYRTHQLLDLVYNKIKPTMLIVRGEKLPTQFHNYQKENPEIKTLQLSYESDIMEISKTFATLEGYYILGIGNMVGWGEKFMQDLKKYKV